MVVEATKLGLTPMVKHAASDPYVEVVGALHEDGSITKLVNEANDTSQFMVVSPDQLTDLDLIAVYHSHPGGIEQPSVTDERGLAPIPAIIITPLVLSLWWHNDRIGYYRIWDRNYAIE